MDGPSRTVHEEPRHRQSRIHLGRGDRGVSPFKNIVKVWETRNEDVHGKNKTEIKNRRKQIDDSLIHSFRDGLR